MPVDGCEGIPTPVPEQAQARLAPATVIANDVSTAKNEKRIRLVIYQLLTAQQVSEFVPKTVRSIVAATNDFGK